VEEVRLRADARDLPRAVEDRARDDGADEVRDGREGGADEGDLGGGEGRDDLADAERREEARERRDDEGDDEERRRAREDVVVVLLRNRGESGDGWVARKERKENGWRQGRGASKAGRGASK
jgi:hypothetical protein